MFKFIKNYQKSKRLHEQIIKYQAKAQLIKYKTLLQANKTRAKVTKTNSILKEIQSIEDVKQAIKESQPDSIWIQLLNEPIVQELAMTWISKMRNNGSSSESTIKLMDVISQVNPETKMRAIQFMKKLTPDQKAEGLSILQEVM